MPNAGDSSPDEPQRFFFVHVQKTAGTTLLIRLGEQFAPEQIYPDDSDGDKFGEMPQMNVDLLLERLTPGGEPDDDVALLAVHLAPQT